MGKGWRKKQEIEQEGTLMKELVYTTVIWVLDYPVPFGGEMVGLQSSSD